MREVRRSIIVLTDYVGLATAPGPFSPSLYNGSGLWMALLEPKAEQAPLADSLRI